MTPRLSRAAIGNAGCGTSAASGAIAATANIAKLDWKTLFAQCAHIHLLDRIKWLRGADMPEEIPKKTVAAHLRSQIVYREEPREVFIVVNDNQPPHVVVCQNVSRIG